MVGVLVESVKTESGEAIAVEIAYATPSEQIIVSMHVPKECTLRQAVALSGITDRGHPLIVEELTLGVFGRVHNPDARVNAGDRIEIYRKLTADPKMARRQRAAKSVKLSGKNGLKAAKQGDYQA